MDKMIREEQLKELKSRKKWELIDNSVWFALQTFMLSLGSNLAITFFIKGLGLEIKATREN